MIPGFSSLIYALAVPCFFFDRVCVVFFLVARVFFVYLFLNSQNGQRIFTGRNCTLYNCCDKSMKFGRK